MDRAEIQSCPPSLSPRIPRPERSRTRAPELNEGSLKHKTSTVRKTPSSPVLPNWVQTLSDFLPLTYLLDSLRWSLTGVAEMKDALIGCGITAAAGLALFLTATRLMRWK